MPQCPECASDELDEFDSPNPDVDIFRCDDCGHVWTAPAPFVIVPEDPSRPVAFPTRTRTA